MASGFTSVRLPIDVARRVDAVLARDGTYRSRAEWVKAAVLRRLEEIKE